MSSTQATKLQDPPSFGSPLSHALYYRDNGNFIILLNRQHQIVKYNLDTHMTENTFDCPYAQLTRIDDHCIDSDNGIIYIIGNSHSRLIWGSFSMNINQWYLLHNIDIGVDKTANCCFIPSPFNEFHVTCMGHYKCDTLKKQIVKFNNNTSLFKAFPSLDDTKGELRSKFIYHKSSQQLMRFEPESDCIYVCDIRTDDEPSDWRPYPTKLPTTLGYPLFYKVILAWDQIIFLFDYFKSSNWTINNSVIWCLDLRHNGKWYQLNSKCPGGEMYPQIIKDDENNIHIMQFLKEHNCHYKVSLFDLIPPEIVRLNRKRFDPLIIGFVKECEKRNKMIFIPMYLKRLIVQFYPIFV